MCGRKACFRAVRSCPVRAMEPRGAWEVRGRTGQLRTRDRGTAGSTTSNGEAGRRPAGAAVGGARGRPRGLRGFVCGAFEAPQRGASDARSGQLRSPWAGAMFVRFAAPWHPRGEPLRVCRGASCRGRIGGKFTPRGVMRGDFCPAGGASVTVVFWNFPGKWKNFPF